MKDTGIIFSFELKNRLKQKSIIITTVIFALIALLLPFIPRFAGSFDSEETTSESETVTEDSKTKPVSVGYMLQDSNVDENFVKSSLVGFNAVEFKDLKDLKNAVKDESVNSGFVFKNDYSLDGYYRNQGLMTDDTTMVIEENGKKFLKDQILTKEGIDPTVYEKVENVEVNITQNALGKNAQTGFISAYLGMFIVYMTVILFGNQVATLVAREKSDRTMEILITTTKPTGLIVGKVFATAVIALGQMLTIILALFIGYSINKSFYPEELMDVIRSSLNAKSLVVFLVYYLLGLLLYLFIFASLGALVSKVEEVANAVVPVSFIIIISFIVTSTTMATPESKALRIASIVPFSSPISFFTRYNLISIPTMDFVLSLGLLILTIILFAFLSIKIYRLGTLNYGNRISLFKALKMLKEED